MWIVMAGLAAATPVQLQHQGRLVGPSGAPVDGPTAVTVGLYTAATGGSPVWQEAYPSLVVDDGYYSVLLGANTAGNPLQHTVFDAPALFVGVSVGGAAVAPRTPLAPVPSAISVKGGLVQASRVEVVGGLLLGRTTAADCVTATAGLLSYDPVAGLVVCNGTSFIPVSARILATSGTGRRWSDGTVARTCREYRFPATIGFLYEGATGDGRYTIDTDGAGAAPPFDVWCDMDYKGGGWTRVYYLDTRAGFFTVDTLERNPTDPVNSQYAILDELEAFRRNGALEFAMFWPGSSYTQPQHWTQTNNPATDAKGALPTGCTTVEVSYTTNGWGCLQRSVSQAVFDGTISPLGNWYYAVGTSYCWGNTTTGCQPSPDAGVHVSELWVR